VWAEGLGEGYLEKCFKRNKKRIEYRE